MSYEIQIAAKNSKDDPLNFQDFSFDSIEELLATVDFMRLGFYSFENEKSLAVRTQPGKRIHLLNYNNDIPLTALQQDLHEKYKIQSPKSYSREQTSFGDKPNTNFDFPHNENTRQLRSSTGDPLPYNLYSFDDANTGSSLLWKEKSPNNYPRIQEGQEFALIERQWAEDHNFNFTGKTKIESPADVAFLFKSLESETVEHVFAVYRLQNDSFLAQHVSMGGITSSLINAPLIGGNAFELNAKSLYIVHNHPSGNLTPSEPDFRMLQKFKDFFEGTSVTVEDGIIMDLRSGQYASFTAHHHFTRLDLPDQEGRTDNIKIYSFGKQAFVENYNPTAIKSSADVAKFLSTKRLGVADKTGLLVLNNANHIVGNFFLSPNQRFEQIAKLVGRYGGTSGIIYTNEQANYQKTLDMQQKLLKAEIRLLDYIQIKSNNAEQIFISLADEGRLAESTRKISEPGQTYNNNQMSTNKDLQDKKTNNSLTQNNTTMETPVNNGNVQNNEQQQNQQGRQGQDQDIKMSYLTKQLLYVGFNLNEQKSQELQKLLNSDEKVFTLGIDSDKTHFGNTMNYTLNFKRSDEGKVFFNSYDALLTTKSGETKEHKFGVRKNTTITAKQALNLLEGRAVKTTLLHKDTGELEPVFMKLKLKDEKTDYGNYKIEVYNEKYGVDTTAILDKSPLTFKNQGDKEKTLKSLERGNIVKAHFNIDGKNIEGRAVLNPQYKTINLYDSHMNRINTYKPIQNKNAATGQSNHKKQYNQQRSI